MARVTTSLDSFFSPRSVAVIGASRDPSKLGHAVVANLVHGGYAQPNRPVYPINPKGGEILGLPVYASLADVPGPIDLAVIVIPYPAVPDALRACGAKHIPAVIVISAGFREAGREGMQRELELVRVARQHAIRLIGPNCLGVIDTHTPLNASFAAGSPPAGPMAFMSQSGALGTAILDWARAGRLGLSKFVSLGNKADISEIDLLPAWQDDPASRVILIYTEGLPNGQAFLRAARLATRSKPVVALKSGVTQAGSRAVSSHTGSLAGSEQAYRAAFGQAGIVRAESLQDLFDFAAAFAYLPSFPGDRVAIVTNAGGPGILAADALERAGLALARFEPERLRGLEAHLPDAASASNPVDLLGDARADRYRLALEQVLADPGVDAVLVMLAPQALTESFETAQVVVRASQTARIPVLACFMGEVAVREGVAHLEAHRVPNFPFPERAAQVLRAMAEYRRARAVPLPEFPTLVVNQALARQAIDRALADGRTALGEDETRSLLEAYGFPAPKSANAATADEAVQAADRLGYPVVLKVASPDILHKTDVGGVKLDLKTPEEVRDAFDLITYRARRYLPEARLLGCLVQAMAPPGLETLIGMTRDPQFGPLVAFGLGGIYVEALHDLTFRVAPFSAAEADAMLSEIRARVLLEGFRGKPAVDRSALVDTLLRVAQLAMDFREIAELDLNPFVVYEQGRGGLTLDLRVVLQPPRSET
ncbi:MAG: acetate--CoA ligase family protein [Anaerolineales bacterium]